MCCVQLALALPAHVPLDEAGPAGDTLLHIGMSTTRCVLLYTPQPVDFVPAVALRQVTCCAELLTRGTQHGLRHTACGRSH